jgi:type I restriction enzyme S subunit
MGSAPFLGLEHVEPATSQILGQGDSSSVKSAMAVFEAGDVLYGRLRPYLNKVVSPSFDGVASTEFLVFKETPALHNPFLRHFLSSAPVVRNAHAGSSGVSLPRVSAERLGSFEINLPPFPEQQRIVAKLEELFSELDAGVAALERAQAKLERYRASVLKAAVEGKLTERWRAENPPAETGEELLQRILVERRKRWEEEQLANFQAKGKKPPRNLKEKYEGPVGPDTSELPKLPEGWCWGSVAHVAECLDRFRIPVNKKDRANRQGDVPYYGANGQVGWIDEALFDEPLVLVVEDETFTGRTKDFSYRIAGRSWVNNHAHVLRAVRSRLSTDYLNYMLARYPFTPLTTGTTGRRKLTQKALMEAPIAIPPLREQLKICHLLGDSLAVVQRTQLELQERSRSPATALRQSILKRAFEGRLAPQDPTDEPACVLLERIRAEREATPPEKTRRSNKTKAPQESNDL